MEFAPNCYSASRTQLLLAFPKSPHVCIVIEFPVGMMLHAHSFRTTASFWNRSWIQCSRPSSGVLTQIKRRTKSATNMKFAILNDSMNNHP